MQRLSVSVQRRRGSSRREPSKPGDVSSNPVSWLLRGIFFLVFFFFFVFFVCDFFVLFHRSPPSVQSESTTTPGGMFLLPRSEYFFARRGKSGSEFFASERFDGRRFYTERGGIADRWNRDNKDGLCNRMIHSDSRCASPPRCDDKYNSTRRAIITRRFGSVWPIVAQIVFFWSMSPVGILCYRRVNYGKRTINSVRDLVYSVGVYTSVQRESWYKCSKM